MQVQVIISYLLLQTESTLLNFFKYSKCILMANELLSNLNYCTVKLKPDYDERRKHVKSKNPLRCV